MIRLLVVTDMHYTTPGEHTTVSTRRGDLTIHLLELLQRQNIDCDAVCVLGDIIDDGYSPNAPMRWQEFRTVLEGFRKPLCVLPGNHDRRPDAFAVVFGKPHPVRVGEYTLVPFWDYYDDADVCTRDLDAMEETLHSARAAGSVIVLQHSTILPAIESSYPYTMPQYLDIASSYTRHGVTLSMSGHFHEGIPAFVDGDVTYTCFPAFCEAPFYYSVVTVDGDNVTVDTHTLEAFL